MKPVKGYKGLYSITKNGDVISHLKRWQPHDKYLKPCNNNGYLYVGLSKNKKVTRRPIHQLMGEAYLIKNHPDDIINHFDGNKSNNKLENLEYVSRSENMKHSYKYLGRKSPAYYKGKTGDQHNLSKAFTLKFPDGSLTRYASGGEFQRKTGFSKETIVYVRRIGKKAHTFTKGKLLGYTVYLTA